MKLEHGLKLMQSLVDIGQAIKHPLEQALGDGDKIGTEDVVDISLEALPVVAAKVGVFVDGDKTSYFDLAVAIARIGQELKMLVMEALGDDGKLSSSEITDIVLAMGPSIISSLEYFAREQEQEQKHTVAPTLTNAAIRKMVSQTPLGDR